MTPDEILRSPEVRAYLHSVRHALAHWSAPQVDAFIEEIVEHVIAAAQEARGHGRTPDPTEILRELGDPLTVAAEADPIASRTSSDVGNTAPDRHLPSSRERRFLATETGRLVVLWAVAIVPLLLFWVGWVLTMPLLWLSPRWTVGDKAIATSIGPVLVGVGILVPQAAFLALVSPLLTWACLLLLDKRRVRILSRSKEPVRSAG